MLYNVKFDGVGFIIFSLKEKQTNQISMAPSAVLP